MANRTLRESKTSLPIAIPAIKGLKVISGTGILGSVLPERVPIVCLAVGELPNVYVTRLWSMLLRHMPVPFDLTCLVDRDRSLPASIRTVDVTGWPCPRVGMRPTTYKLGLYDPARLPLGEFLYLDTSLVIQKDLTSLLEFAFGQPHELVAVKGMSYETYNSCVLRVRQGGRLTAIPKAYEAGTTFDQPIPGDQDFATGVIRQNGWEDSVTRFPNEMIQSFKIARQSQKTERGSGRTMLENATIVKFHGEPKMDQLLDPRYRFAEVVKKRNPFHRHVWFWVREVQCHWR